MRMNHPVSLLAGTLFFLAIGHSIAAEPLAETSQGDSLSHQVKTLWASTQLIIEKEAQAHLSDSEYQARRTPLFSTWVKLQAVAANDSGVSPEVREHISRIIPRILELIDHVYGFPDFPEEKRQKQRQNIGRTIYLIKDITQVCQRKG